MNVLRRFLLMMLLLPVFGGGSVSLHAQTAPVTDLADGGAGIALAHRVELLKKALLTEDQKALATAMQEVDLLRRDFGTLDVTPLVEAMALWARSMGDAGKPDVGLKALQSVERWAPRHPMLLGTRIVLLRQKGISGYFEGLPDVMDLTRLRLNSELHRGLFLVHHVSWLRMMVAFLLWGWAFVMAIRYRRVFRYLWEHPLSKHLSGGIGRGVVGAFLLTLPVLAGLDPGFCALAWLWLLVPFLHVQELKITILVVVLQLVHPLLALLEPSVVQRPRPSIVSLQMRPSAKPLDWSTFRELPELDRAYLKGWQLLQSRSWAAAEAQFRDLLKTHPQRSGVANNLGVALFQQGRTDESEHYFTLAFQADNTQPEVLMNQGILAYRRLDSAAGAAKQDEARRLAPERYAQLSDASQARTEQRTYAIPLPDSDDRSEALMRHYGEGATLPRNSHMAGLVLWALVPIGLTMLLILRARQSMREAHPTQCVRCGEPFHTTDSPDVEVCSKCHHLFVLKDGLHGDARKAKVDEAATFQKEQRWIHRTLLVITPGLDLAFLGHARAGFVEFSLMALAVGIVLGTGRAIRYPGEILADPTSLWLPFGIGFLGILYLRSWLKLLLRRG